SERRRVECRSNQSGDKISGKRPTKSPTKREQDRTRRTRRLDRGRERSAQSGRNTHAPLSYAREFLFPRLGSNLQLSTFDLQLFKLNAPESRKSTVADSPHVPAQRWSVQSWRNRSGHPHRPTH